MYAACGVCMKSLVVPAETQPPGGEGGMHGWHALQGYLALSLQGYLAQMKTPPPRTTITSEA